MSSILRSARSEPEHRSSTPDVRVEVASDVLELARSSTVRALAEALGSSEKRKQP